MAHPDLVGIGKDETDPHAGQVKILVDGIHLVSEVARRFLNAGQDRMELLLVHEESNYPHRQVGSMQNEHPAVDPAGNVGNRRLDPNLLLHNEEADPEPDEGDHRNKIEEF